MDSSSSLPPLPPGPRGLWFLGSVLEQLRDPLGLLLRGREHFGDVVRFKMGPGGTVILLNHPEHVKHVLVSHPQNYVKPSRPPALLGQGLFTSRGDFWKRQRRMMQSAFHRERLVCLVDRSVEGTQAMLTRLEAHARAGTPFDAEREMTRVLRSILGHNIFSTDITALSPQLHEAFDAVMASRSKKISLWAMLPLPRPGRRRAQLGTEQLDEAVYALIRKRLKEPGPEEDLLAGMIPARDTQGEPMTETQLRDEAMTLLIAGHEATVSALTWVWYLLDRHPDVAARVRAELDTVLGGAAPTARTISQLPYCRQVFLETMRLYPPAWVIGREVQQADSLGGYTLPAGATVVCSPYVMHRHPAYWEEPERFLPERFAPEQRGAQTRYTYFPFGGGQRMCIGDSLAEVHALVVMAAVLSRYQFQVEPGFRVELEAGATIRPARGLRVRAVPLSRA